VNAACCTLRLAFWNVSSGVLLMSSWSTWCWLNTPILSFGERVTIPESGAFSPRMHLRSVDLPIPLGPTRAMRLFTSKCSVTLEKSTLSAA